MIKKTSILFLQFIIILIAVAVLIALIRFPQTEGRAKNLDLISIYKDPLVIYGYLASIPFFIGLFQAVLLLDYIGRNNVFSNKSVKALRSIKLCAAIVVFLIVIAVIYIKITHHPDDDPAGFYAMCVVAAFSAATVATAASVFEKLLQNAVEMKSENDLTI